MITVLTGENSFEITRALQRIMDGFGGAVERIDGAELEMKQLPDLLMGVSLFADKRLVIIRGIADNKTVWNELGSWLGRVSDDIHLVLVDAKPDKRTKTYKDLKAQADIQEFGVWGERDLAKAEAWVVAEAQTMKVALDKKSVQMLIHRVGPDQWQLYHALQKLAVLDEVTAAVIEETIEASPTENVFYLFDAALKGDVRRVGDIVRVLEQTDDPYMVFGLLASQAFQLAALSVADKPDSTIAKDIGAHPFALSKLAPHAARLGRGGCRRIIEMFAEADDRMKSSPVGPWIIIDQALVRIATSVK